MPEEPERVELERLHHGGPLEDLLNTLEKADIAYQKASTTPVFDIASIGSDTAAQVVVSVRQADYHKARQALEQHHLATPVPEGHHLLDASDDELMEILANQKDWSAFDVAHARRMADQRGLDLNRIDQLASQSMAVLKEGRQAPRLLVIAGFAFGTLAACGYPFFILASLGIGWSLLSMKNKTPEGTFPFYDQASRKTGQVMLWFSLASGALGLWFALSPWLR